MKRILSILVTGALLLGTASTTLPAQALFTGQVEYQALNSSIAAQADGTVKTIYSEEISFVLDKSKLPQDWTQTKWVNLGGADLMNCSIQSNKYTGGNQYIEYYFCSAKNSSGIYRVHAQNANNVNQVSNEIIVIISAPQEGSFIGCVNPPQNYTPSTCIDQYKNGEWVRNSMFKCNADYVKSGNQCIPANSINPSFTERCMPGTFYGIDNDFYIELRDRDTNGQSSRCNADDWKYEIRSGEVKFLSKDSKQIHFNRGTGGTVYIEVYGDNYNQSFMNTYTIKASYGPSNITILPANDYFAPEDSIYEFTAEGGNRQTDTVQKYYQYWSVFNLTESRNATDQEVQKLYEDSNQTKVKYQFKKKSNYDVQVTVCDLNKKNCIIKSRNVNIHVKSRPTTSPPQTKPQPIIKTTPQKAFGVEYEDEVRVKFDANENPFSDTRITSLAGRAAAELNRRKVIGGFADGEFKGRRTVNRAEAAKFLLLARGYDVSTSITRSRFSDTLPSEWYAKYTEKAANLGIIKGYSDGTFRPANQVITAEFLKMISLTFNIPTNLPYSYQDKKDYTGAWFWKYAGAAQKYNLFPHRKNRLRPTTPLSRNEIAVAIYNYLKNRNN